MKNRKAVLDYLSYLLRELSEWDGYIDNDEEVHEDITYLISDIYHDLKNWNGPNSCDAYKLSCDTNN